MSARHGWAANVMVGTIVAHAHGVRLKPCPFCYSYDVDIWMGPSPHVTCGGCGADGPLSEDKGRDLHERQRHAAYLWNVRW